MKKAKNALAIIAIVLSVVAAILAIGLPLFDTIAAGKPYGEAPLVPQIQAMLNNLRDLFTFGWFSDLANHIPELIALGIGGIGLILFIVLFVLLICKKHVKGLGWWIPLLIVFALSVAVVGGNKFNNAGYQVTSFVEVAYIGNIGTYVGIAAGVLMILSLIFYIVYVCKARARQKQAAVELSNSKEELHNVIKEALGK